MAVPLIFVPELHWHIAFRPNLGYLFSPDLVIIPDVVVIPDLDWCAGIVLLAHSDASDMQHDAVNKPKKCTHTAMQSNMMTACPPCIGYGKETLLPGLDTFSVFATEHLNSHSYDTPCASYILIEHSIWLLPRPILHILQLASIQRVMTTHASYACTLRSDQGNRPAVLDCYVTTT